MRIALTLMILALSSPPPSMADAISIAHVTAARAGALEAGLSAAELAIADSNASGKFLGISLELRRYLVGADSDHTEVSKAIAASGTRFVIANVDAVMLSRLAGAADARDLLFINARERADSLREEHCAHNLLHTIPSHAMLADGLAQYLAARRWRRWFLVIGRAPEDALYASAVRRAAKRFGAQITVEKQWPFETWNARADTGHTSLQSDIPAFTNVGDYDVLMVADEKNDFGDYLEGRTALPRPIAGSHGLVTAGFSPMSEEWGAMQLQSRFAKLAGRRMGEVDYAIWAAVRSIAEAAVRTRSSDPAIVAAFLRGPEFLLAGFKGYGQSYREWDGQMRQPVLIVGSRMLISASPQAGYLHRGSPLDALGVDREESRCKFAN